MGRVKQKRLRSPIKWFGGKGKMVAKILPYLPESKIYIEPFGGGASILIAKKPSSIEVYNDIDSGLVNFFKVISDPELFEKFYRRVEMLPYSRELYYEYRKDWVDEEDNIIRAIKWFVVARQSFSGRFGQCISMSVTLSSSNMAATCSSWISTINMLPEISQRLRRVQIEHDDFRQIFKTYDTEETLFYCDPPYVHSTRSGGKYSTEMTDIAHKELIRMLLKIEGMCVISGYKNEIYKQLEDNNWKRIDFETACRAAGRTRGSKIQGKGSAKKMQPRTESLWICPKVQKALQCEIE